MVFIAQSGAAQKAPRLTSEESHELAKRVHVMGAYNLLKLLRQLPTSEESSNNE